MADDNFYNRLALSYEADRDLFNRISGKLLSELSDDEAHDLVNYISINYSFKTGSGVVVGSNPIMLTKHQASFTKNHLFAYDDGPIKFTSRIHALY